jgi:hypothetical protein
VGWCALAGVRRSGANGADPYTGAFQAFGDAPDRENVVRLHRAITRIPDPQEAAAGDPNMRIDRYLLHGYSMG